MFNMHRKLNTYYEDHVRLGRERGTLALHRDRNLERLRAGLEKLGHPSDFDHRNQGSYAMHTINQHSQKDYDIDVAIIFGSSDLPGSALNARRRIEGAMREGGGNFSQPPEAKTNAVRVYYADGHHIDLAIYRHSDDEYGTQIHEHAGSVWMSRDPMDITSWFNETVRELSPNRDRGATVAANQMRRVVRWLKAFAKSRESWDLPGGLIVSVLVAECYVRDLFRDDVCLHNTMVSIRDRLQGSEHVTSPVDSNQLLTDRPVDTGRVGRLRDKLDSATSELEVLRDPECTEEQAVKAWHSVFQHPFWTVTDASESAAAYGRALGEAARAGNIFVTATGKVETSRPVEQHIEAPRQRFYGEH